ncbi:MAG: type VI secretion system-associated protein TagF [Pseudomonadota bacterium]
MSVLQAAGYYGKFPELGDFVKRRLPGSFVDSWDGWLQSCLQCSKDNLEDRWLGIFLESPVWRFCLSSGLCGEAPWAGLLMPSVDRVGRYFPLTLACELPKNSNLFHIAMKGQSWFDAAEELMLGMLQSKDFNLERFDDIVIGLGTLDTLAEYAPESEGLGFGSAWCIPLGQGDHLGAAVLGLTQQMVQLQIGGHSLWWSRGSEQVASSLLLVRDLPSDLNFTAMLDGDWTGRNWEVMPVTVAEPENQARSP